jgi:ComF family protein
MKIVKHLFNLFYPSTCICCEQNLLDQEKIICIECRADLPFAENGDFISNQLTLIFEGRVLIEKGASLLYYHPSGKVKKLIHELKYKNNQEVGEFLGKWFGERLLKSTKFKDIDFILPVPLHIKKQQKRGYNQLTKFGDSLSTVLHTKYLENVLIRSSTSKTQTFKNRIERFENLMTNFSITDTALLKNKHILLIDDVVTTGATLEACCKELLETENIRISIATIALTE